MLCLTVFPSLPPRHPSRHHQNPRQHPRKHNRRQEKILPAQKRHHHKTNCQPPRNQRHQLQRLPAQSTQLPRQNRPKQKKCRCEIPEPQIKIPIAPVKRTHIEPHRSHRSHSRFRSPTWIHLGKSQRMPRRKQDQHKRRNSIQHRCTHSFLPARQKSSRTLPPIHTTNSAFPL